MKYKDRKDRPDALWHVTGRVNWRMWHLAPDGVFQLLVRELNDALARFDVDALGWVFLSNHYHLTLRSPPAPRFRELTGRFTPCRHFRHWPATHPKSTVIGQCMRRFKNLSSKAIQAELGLSGHFWEGRHDRRRLTDAWDLVVAIAYDHRNPVRAGMVLRPEDYPRSSANWWAAGADSPVALATRPEFPFESRESIQSGILELQREKHLDDVMEAFGKSGARIDSAEGRARLEAMMRDAGLELSRCGSAAAVNRA